MENIITNPKICSEYPSRKMQVKRNGQKPDMLNLCRSEIQISLILCRIPLPSRYERHGQIGWRIGINQCLSRWKRKRVRRDRIYHIKNMDESQLRLEELFCAYWQTLFHSALLNQSGKIKTNVLTCVGPKEISVAVHSGENVWRF